MPAPHPFRCGTPTVGTASVALAGIEDSLGIEQAADRTHSFKLVSAELLAHILEAAASVLTGKAPAEFERCVVERVMSRRRAPRVVRVRRVVMQVGVDIAVSGVPKTDEALAVTGGDSLETTHGLEERTARHGHIPANAIRAEHIG